MLGIAAGHQVAGQRLVLVGAAGGEADGAGLQGLLRQPRHRVDVLGRRLLAGDGALAHDIDAQGVVGDLRGDVDGARQARQRVEVFREALPVPFEAFGQRDAGDVLDPLHQIDQRLVLALRTGAKPTPQLPNTMVVAPCQEDGARTGSQVAWPSSWHGVTTDLFGNCGVGFAPVKQEDHSALIGLMEWVEEIPGIALADGLKWNWETFPEYSMRWSEGSARSISPRNPHHPLRVYVMGDRAIRREKATADDIARCAA